MKKSLYVFFLLLLMQIKGTDRLYAQQDTPTHTFRIYEDNDFINFRGKGTDEAYTNGTRLDFFYTKKKPSRFFIDRAMPKAGDSSINTYGWGVMQIMITPRDISKTDFQPNDYPYSGALFITHTLYSYDPKKNFDFQTELVAGVMGPAAFAGPFQTFIHRLIHYQKPMGWNNQLKNDLLLNLNFTAEKQLAHYGNWIEVIGGGQVFFGTMINGVAAYPMVRIGKMDPYFNGYMRYADHTARKSKRKMQAYLVIKPEAQLIFYNALLEGGLFSTNQDRADEKRISGKTYHDLRRLIGEINYGAVVSLGHFSISIIEKTSTAYMKGLYNHQVGNLSLYYNW